jgi:hypothetical protein
MKLSAHGDAAAKKGNPLRCDRRSLRSGAITEENPFCELPVLAYRGKERHHISGQVDGCSGIVKTKRVSSGVEVMASAGSPPFPSLEI